ncbi:hypothetical protein A8C56_20075 [Niabella ginsenosidivorans]|uniref:Lipoprotein n=1 Tax=Niabella ginsenosidivorans TaxID=1176587 RepID=A0A1A9I6L8_9BACT|nr:hypothetical protein [Niabella ginsenosidivorans]ANH82975.1 hypothetical protein A8C56_20075 [Niabella ginsenosidivorans]
MKKALIVTTVLLGFLVIACSTPGKKQFTDAVSYDQFIIDRMEQMQQALFAVQRVTGSDSSGAQADIGSYITRIDSVTKTLRELPDFNGDTGYRDAAVRLGEFYKRSINGPYTEIASIYKEEKDTAQANSRVDTIISRLQQEETAADNDFIKQRNAFAAKNHIKIEPAIPAE